MGTTSDAASPCPSGGPLLPLFVTRRGASASKWLSVNRLELGHLGTDIASLFTRKTIERGCGLRPDFAFRLRTLLFAAVSVWMAGSLGATSVIPITDRELYERADVIVHGIVVSSDATADDRGVPETLSVIEPLEVLKGRLSGPLVLHQVGGRLPDGRFFQLWGRPEYVPGREVIVFAIARPQGEYQTAEMLLGKFEIQRDERGVEFAVPGLRLARTEVTVHPRPRRGGGEPTSDDPARELTAMLRSLRSGGRPVPSSAVPQGRLAPVVHAIGGGPRLEPEWGNINDSLWRWNNNATAAWTLNGTANMTGGGTSEATGALAAWTNDPNSNINYTAGSGTGNVIYLNATSSALGCGWSTCLSGGGTIGCGGPNGGGMNAFRGDNYTTITGGTVELRASCSFNGFTSTITQSVLTHELGHTLGLGHPDQNVSPHDVCRGDEGAAIMFSIAQNRTTLGTDDQDAIRWLYGDGLNWCTASALSVTGITPSFGPTVGGTLVTIVGSSFQVGAGVSIGGVAATGVAVVNSSTITATTGAHAAATVGVVVTNPDAQSATLSGGFTYSSGTGFFTLTPCRVLDTRNPVGPLGGPALAANADRVFTVTGQCGIPVDAKTISVNVTATQPTAAGDLRLYAAGGFLPVSTTITYKAGQTQANNAVAAIGTSGGVAVHCDQPSGTVQFILDVNGYFK
jgi:hypothetical protein